MLNAPKSKLNCHQHETYDATKPAFNSKIPGEMKMHTLSRKGIFLWACGLISIISVSWIVTLSLQLESFEW